MPRYLYISLQQDDRIDQYSVDPETGGLSKLSETVLPGMPAPLASDPSRRFLFAGRRKAGEFGLSAFTIGTGTGRPDPVNHVPLEGDPTHISVDRSGHYLLSAYYYQARVGVHSFGSDGALDANPIEWRETGIGAHYIQTDPANSYAFTPHIAEGSRSGANAIFQFRFDGSTGKLTPNDPDRCIPNAPEGPRHFCFHPSLNVLYTSNEQGCGVTAYSLNRNDGTLSPFDTVSTLPEGYEGINSCSQIQVTPSGKYLYAPNRGHNSIAGFSLDQSDGKLTPLGQTPTEPIPRAFSLDPSGSYLYASGLESGQLACYRVNPDSGALEPREVYEVGNAPMWVLIIDL